MKRFCLEFGELPGLELFWVLGFGVMSLNSLNPIPKIIFRLKPIQGSNFVWLKCWHKFVWPNILLRFCDESMNSHGFLLKQGS